MSIDRNIPVICQFSRGAYVIKMTMSKNDRVGCLVEVLLCPLADVGFRKRKTGINQCPGSVRMGDGKDVDKDDAQSVNPRRHSINSNYLLFWDINPIHASSSRSVCAHLPTPRAASTPAQFVASLLGW